MKKITLLLLLISTSVLAQIRGTVSDEKGVPLPFVSIVIENSYKGTTTNDGGKYELGVKSAGRYTLVFQSLGYKTKKVSADVLQFPHTIDVVLAEENIELNEIVLNPKDNPANGIIKKAIAARKENSEKTARYRA